MGSVKGSEGEDGERENGREGEDEREIRRKGEGETEKGRREKGIRWRREMGRRGDDKERDGKRCIDIVLKNTNIQTKQFFKVMSTNMKPGRTLDSPPIIPLCIGSMKFWFIFQIPYKRRC